ncbi:MAG: HupE/UreJ family protein [Nitrosomonas sp.]|nr:HupE/UreJ family protein [Nitrosomonas sp.]
MLPLSASAHTGLGEHNGWAHGFFHPLSGVDHILAMVAVGIWATQMGGRAVWLMPLVFVMVMILGGMLGMVTLPFIFVEHGIALSLLVMGGMIAATVRLPLIASIMLISLFALCHGYAHGNEMLPGLSIISYATGFAFATALLHLCGVGLALGVNRLGRMHWLRLSGVVTALVGVDFLLVS